MSDVQDKTGSRRQLIDLIGKEHNEKNEFTPHPSMIVDAKEMFKCRLVLTKRIYRFGQACQEVEVINAVLLTEDNKVIDLPGPGWEQSDFCFCHLCGAAGDQRELSMIAGKFICEDCGGDEKVETGMEDVRAYESILLDKFTKELHSKREGKARTIKCKHLWCGEGNEYCEEHKDPNHPDRQ